jgi:uncharacterized damage-inducible protein DinB
VIGPDYVRVMATYNAEMNRRVYAAAARLPEAALAMDRGAFFGSILATLNHLVWADRTWMHRFAGWQKPGGGIPSGIGLYPDFAGLHAARTVLDEDLIAWAAKLESSWLDGDLTWFSGATGREQHRPVALLVVHMFNHQTHHRGQVHAMLTAAGERTGDTDLPVILP